MTVHEQHNFARLLDGAASGDARATDELLPLVYDELRRMARAHLANEGHAATLQPTELVHAAYLRLVGDSPCTWNSRGHFFSAAAQAMRRILVDRARARTAAKRGGGERAVSLSLDEPAAPTGDDTELVALDESLARLEEYDPLMARVVMLRFFSGLTNEQAASALGLSVSQVKTQWGFARAWLIRDLQRDGRS